METTVRALLPERQNTKNKISPIKMKDETQIRKSWETDDKVIFHCGVALFCVCVLSFCVLKRHEALNTSLCVLPVQKEVKIISWTPRGTLGLCVVKDSGNLTTFWAHRGRILPKAWEGTLGDGQRKPFCQGLVRDQIWKIRSLNKAVEHLPQDSWMVWWFSFFPQS